MLYNGHFQLGHCMKTPNMNQSMAVYLAPLRNNGKYDVKLKGKTETFE